MHQKLPFKITLVLLKLSSYVYNNFYVYVHSVHILVFYSICAMYVRTFINNRLSNVHTYSFEYVICIVYSDQEPILIVSEGFEESE